MRWSGVGEAQMCQGGAGEMQGRVRQGGEGAQRRLHDVLYKRLQREVHKLLPLGPHLGEKCIVHFILSCAALQPAQALEAVLADAFPGLFPERSAHTKIG